MQSSTEGTPEVLTQRASDITIGTHGDVKCGLLFAEAILLRVEHAARKADDGVARRRNWREAVQIQRATFDSFGKRSRCSIHQLAGA
jgi:hypothetical protein